jgi:hypothetical protein
MAQRLRAAASGWLFREAVAKASEHVSAALRLGNEDDKIVWWWPMLALLACKACSGYGKCQGRFEKHAHESTLEHIEITPHDKEQQSQQ